MSLYSSSNSLSIYYFLIANPFTQKEIGTFVDNSETGNSISDFNKIVEKSKEIFLQICSNSEQLNHQRNYIIIDKFTLYYTIISSSLNGGNNHKNSTFYLTAVKSNNINLEHLVFELIQDIDHQGIKKLVDKHGELTYVGRKNLKFSIEKYQEANKKKYKNILLDSERESLFSKKPNEESFIEDCNSKENTNASRSEGSNESNDNNRYFEKNNCGVEAKIRYKEKDKKVDDCYKPWNEPNVLSECNELEEIKPPKMEERPKVNEKLIKLQQEREEIAKKLKKQKWIILLTIMLVTITLSGVGIYFLFQ